VRRSGEGEGERALQFPLAMQMRFSPGLAGLTWLQEPVATLSSSLSPGLGDLKLGASVRERMRICWHEKRGERRLLQRERGCKRGLNGRGEGEEGGRKVGFMGELLGEQGRGLG
jgi:hypothetical protein